MWCRVWHARSVSSAAALAPSQCAARSPKVVQQPQHNQIAQAAARLLTLVLPPTAAYDSSTREEAALKTGHGRQLL